MAWTNPKTIIGPPAEGDKYLKRPAINERFWHAIDNGEHILFTAPRRVGKSSVMKDIEHAGRKGFLIEYLNIESDKSSQAFYKRLWHLVLKQMNSVTSTKAWLANKIKSWHIEELSVDGKVKFAKTDFDYKQGLFDLIEQLGKEQYKIVLLLDEFPDVISAIAKNESPGAAIEVLHTLRAIRHEEQFKNFSLVLAGSIGLEYVIASIDRTKLINDLKPIPIPALTSAEAHELLDVILDGATIQVDNATRDYMLNRISHLMPYYIQLTIAQCNELALALNEPKISNATIDQAFTDVSKMNERFTDWEKRLSEYLDPIDLKYCIGLLTRCAHQNFTIQEAYNYSKGKKSKPKSTYRELIDDVLIKDGYLVLNGSHLQFLSPFLQAWWMQRHAAFEIED